jgi:hypothetical protein
MVDNSPPSPWTPGRLETLSCRIWSSLFSCFSSERWPPASCKRSFSLTVILAMGLAMSSCQPVPRPFKSDGANDARHKLLRPGVEANLLVMPIQGAASSRAMAEQVAKALRRHGVAAGTDGASRSGYSIWGTTVSDGDAAPKIALRWRLLDTYGLPAGTAEHDAEVDPEAWRNGEYETMVAAAENAARTIVAMIRGDAVQAASAPKPAKPAPMELSAIMAPLKPPAAEVTKVVETAAPPVAAGKALRTITIEWKGQAPGDGATALPGAMSQALKGLKLTVTDTPLPGGFKLVGQAFAGTEKMGVQTIAVEWSLTRADGSAVALVGERFNLRRGQTDRGWGEVAARAAQGSAGTVAELLRVFP